MSKIDTPAPSAWRTRPSSVMALVFAVAVLAIITVSSSLGYVAGYQAHERASSPHLAGAPAATGQRPDGAVVATPSATGDQQAPVVDPPDARKLPADLVWTSVRLTGYGFRDNDCGGPGTCIAWPTQGTPQAGGDGTYEHPTALAVGRSDDPKRPGYWLPRGTLVYLLFGTAADGSPIGRYGVVADVCGACHGPFLDVWVDGRATSSSAAYACMASFTGRHQVVLDPRPGLLVARPGDISTAAGCRP